MTTERALYIHPLRQNLRFCHLSHRARLLRDVGAPSPTKYQQHFTNETHKKDRRENLRSLNIQ